MTRRASALCSRMGGLLGLALVLSSIPAWGRDAVSRSAADPGPAWRARLESARVPGGHAGPFRPTAAPSLDGSPVEYLILTNDEMAAEFQKLAAWKTAKGVPAVVRTLAQVEVSSVQGSDLAETIRMYIRAAYLFWGVRFVLLGGDTDVIPGRYAEMELLGLSHPISELYYSCLNGNWNADGDAFFGEAFVSASDPGDDADLLSEVFLGRAPVSDVAEAALFVAKTLEHENPQLTDYQEKLLVLAEVLFPADYDPNGPPPSADGAVFAQEIVALIPEWMQSTLLYEAHELWPDGMPLTVESATSGINSGYGAVVHIGHGYRYTLSVGNGSLDVGSAEGFANGTRAGLFYLLNCTATAFDFESMAEALLLNPNGGATVVVGAAREAFPLAARDYQLAFFEQLYVAGERRVGVAMTRSREELVDGAYLPTVDRWTQLVYTLLGDPELSVWTRARTDLQIAGVPAAFEVGGQALALQVRNTDGPLAGALVCVRKAGEDYRFGRTDAAGRVEFDLQPRSPGDAQLTVTAADHLPVQLTVPVVSQGIGLVVAGTGLQDDGGGSGVGNLDGRLDAGETVTLGVPLRNGGSTPTSGISATLVSNDAAVEVLQGSSAYPDLGPGGLRSALTPFVVRAAPGVVDHSVVTLTLSLDHAGGSDTRRLELLVHAARLRLVGLRLDDARAGNGDGVQDANEEVDLYYTLKNDGSGTAMNVELRLESPGAGMEILSGTVAPGDLLPGSTTEGTTALAVREADVIQSRSARLVLAHLQDPDGEIRNVELRPPAAPSGLRFGVADAGGVVHLEWERNTDADLLGYHVYRALSAQGPFERVNADAALQSYFRDTGLEPSTRYHYRAAAVDSALVEGPPSGPVSVSTNPPQLGGWPLAVNNTTASSPGVADIDADGALDVVAAANQVFAWDAQGIELFDADNNAFTWGVFYGSSEVFGSVSLADLDPQPGREIVVATWDPEDRFVAVVDGGGRTLPGWPQPLAPAGADLRGAHVPPVIANLDEQGAPEILLAARDGRLYGWHADGTEIADGDDDPGTHGVLLDTGSLFLRCAPGVADLDPERPGLEIAVGSTDGTLYVLDASGAPLPGWPRITFGEGTPFGTWFASGISLADLDRDGSLEMVFLESGARLHAMHLDGSELDGFPVPGIKATSPSVVPSPAIADLAGDAALEIVVASSDGRVHVFDATGASLLAGGPIDSGAHSESSPILGDVDGDGEIEIVFGNEDGVLQAWNLDATPVDGFPMSLGAEVRATPTLTDLDGNGTAELLVQSWDGFVRVSDLGVPWSPERFPWPTYRGSMHRTGEFGFEEPTPVVVSDLRGTFEPARGVRLAWRGVAEPPGAQIVWRIRRAGPFESNPLEAGPAPVYNSRPIGEIHGTGDLEFVDPGAEPGSWHVYILGLLERRLGNEAEEVQVGSIAVEAAVAPSMLRILPNVPNPFNPGTRIHFEVPSRMGASRVAVRLAMFDVHGRRIRLLVHDELTPGSHTVNWDGRDDDGNETGSGIYVARLQVAGAVVTRKLTLLR